MFLPHVRQYLFCLQASNSDQGNEDLYLIRPPPEAEHKPVKPENIVVAGDSAGGGLTLALLQVLRDADLPLPAGGVLISPWCDLTHSFPSIHTNTSTVSGPILAFAEENSRSTSGCNATMGPVFPEAKHAMASSITRHDIQCSEKFAKSHSPEASRGPQLLPSRQ